MSILDTGVKNVRNVNRFTIGNGAINELPNFLRARRRKNEGPVIFFIDEFFRKNNKILEKLTAKLEDEIVFVCAKNEPSTDTIDNTLSELRSKGILQPCAIVGMGGGTTMDTAKAISNLFTNPGNAEIYQGWDLVKNPGIYKIAIPTLSGTGAEATRTCVMTNKKSGLKLGMNSDFTVYDQIIMDFSLTETVPRDQYFFTGMDAYIHCIEALTGNYRNAIGDAYSRETISLCRQVFFDKDMMSPENREKLMVASYLGGCSIATSYVGLVHPFSAGLSVVLGLHHCVANCIVMRAMKPFYPSAYDEFWEMANIQRIDIPKELCRNLDHKTYDQLYEATIIHQKPLTNALGASYKDILTADKVREIFRAM
jgi:3-deoxy-alpha-D-manno-octulosonate 8-oxidase